MLQVHVWSPGVREGRNALTVKELLGIIALAHFRSFPALSERRRRTIRQSARIGACKASGNDLDAHVIKAWVAGVLRVARIVHVIDVRQEAAIEGGKAKFIL